jgi:adenine deaminase
VRQQQPESSFPAFASASEVQAPLCGFYSLEPMEKLHQKLKHLEESLRINGVKWEKPVLTIDTLGTPAIPHLKISHHGTSD